MAVYSFGGEIGNLSTNFGVNFALEGHLSFQEIVYLDIISISC